MQSTEHWQQFEQQPVLQEQELSSLSSTPHLLQCIYKNYFLTYPLSSPDDILSISPPDCQITEIILSLLSADVLKQLKLN